jgi:hypothetical protein
VQVLLAQQVWPAPPQLPQLPLVQLPPTLGQVAPALVQVLFTQQPPAPQVLLEQHGSPGPPQLAQMPALAPLHTLPVSQLRPAQQVCPAPPHTVHTPPRHAAPLAEQVLFAQHGSPSPPHALQLPAMQAAPEAVH